ncbi:MAG: uracil-DNA glycosylase [Alphaproteobacteria bacterium]|nr:uracil-DNA glycosylase [Alphaproteobacteria bacterium]
MFSKRNITHLILGTQPYPTPPSSAPEIPPSASTPTQPTPLTPKKILKPSSMQDLEHNLLHCGSHLKKGAQSFVFSDGKPGNIMLIGEAPGAQEDEQGKPFVGKSGQLLMRMFECIGLPRNKLYITNIVPWRPENNRTPTKQEILFFQPFMKQHIALANPPLIVLVGSTPLNALFPKPEGITRVHGTTLELSLEEKTFTCIPIYHPAYLLRNPFKKKEAWYDLLTIQAKVLTC